MTETKFKKEIVITGQTNQGMKCEFCGHEIVGTVFRVLGSNNHEFRVSIHYYCALCFEQLSSDYRRKYGERALIEC